MTRSILARYWVCTRNVTQTSSLWIRATRPTISLASLPRICRAACRCWRASNQAMVWQTLFKLKGLAGPAPITRSKSCSAWRTTSSSTSPAMQIFCALLGIVGQAVFAGGCCEADQSSPDDLNAQARRTLFMRQMPLTRRKRAHAAINFLAFAPVFTAVKTSAVCWLEVTTRLSRPSLRAQHGNQQNGPAYFELPRSAASRWRKIDHHYQRRMTIYIEHLTNHD